MLVLDLDTNGTWVLPRGVPVSSGRLVALTEQVRRAIALALQVRTERAREPANAQAPVR